MGDLHLELPNGSEKTKTIFKNAVHTPDMAFTLISISQLNKAGFSVRFNKAMCTVKTPKGKSIATIPCKDGLYKILAVQSKTPNESATVASVKMSISEAHRKLGHIAHSVVKHAITNGLRMGIQLDTETKPEICLATLPKRVKNPSREF